MRVDVSELNKIEELIKNNYKNLSGDISEIKMSVKDLSQKIEKDHDTLILLKSEVALVKVQFEDNLIKEEKYGRSFDHRLKNIDQRIKLNEDYIVEDRIKTENKELQEEKAEIEKNKKEILAAIGKYAPWVIALLSGGGWNRGNNKMSFKLSRRSKSRLSGINKKIIQNRF